MGEAVRVWGWVTWETSESSYQSCYNPKTDLKKMKSFFFFKKIHSPSSWTLMAGQANAQVSKRKDT